MHVLRNLLGASLFSLSLATLAGTPVNINTADSEALVDGLNGVGPQKALAIVRYRQEHGPFKRVEDLALVDGIGEKTVQQNRSNMTVATPVPAKSSVPNKN
jgi:competence protein ComEA